MEQKSFQLDKAVAVLEKTPESLRALLNDLPDEWVHATEGESKWSPYQVIIHLINNERTNWMPRARHIVSGNPGPIPSFDRKAETEEQAATLKELLILFAELRKKNLAELSAMKLTPADLDRNGVHPELGDVKLRNLLATWVVHDLDHVAQIARTMAKVYSDATGPWSVYLSILRDRLN